VLEGAARVVGKPLLVVGNKDPMIGGEIGNPRPPLIGRELTEVRTIIDDMAIYNAISMT
jgi:hypothetical protein